MTSLLTTRDVNYDFSLALLANARKSTFSNGFTCSSKRFALVASFIGSGPSITLSTSRLLLSIVLLTRRTRSLTHSTTTSTRYDKTLFSILITLFVALVATVCAAPTEILGRDITKTDNTVAPLVQCGVFNKIEEEGVMPLYANGHYENIEDATHMAGIENRTQQSNTD
ncbi:hypothetical protein CC86DRAFT_453714 [Ophiobolus disseminans]|uniref:Uncharacterized protein n=1 Tax=Ophiobolus disseminans TaxID=1469910 RepID=A0A6A7A6N4_9PLEO|nr:hypothetical protein CC86DRAFT_453714 [Ophiobolus disseminans]